MKFASTEEYHAAFNGADWSESASEQRRLALKLERDTRGHVML